MGVKFQVTFDCGDVPRMADFWALALGYQLQPPPEGFESWEEWATAMGIPEELWDDRSAVVDPDGTGPRVFFQRVPEGKTAKNRVHLDLSVGGGRQVDIEERKRIVQDKVTELIGAGATWVESRDEEGEYFVVMQDPEGNEFCVQ